MNPHALSGHMALNHARLPNSATPTNIVRRVSRMRHRPAGGCLAGLALTFGPVSGSASRATDSGIHHKGETQRDETEDDRNDDRDAI